MNFILHIFLPSVAFAQEAAQSTSPVAVLGLQTKLFLGQLVTFSVVLFILWKYAFTPITAALQKRTEKIENSLNDAERIGKEKAEFEKWRQIEMAKARQEAGAVITHAQTEANKVKDESINLTKQEQQKLIDQAKKQIEQEKNTQLQAAKGELADLITNATEKILKQKLDGAKDKQLIQDSLKSI